MAGIDAGGHGKKRSTNHALPLVPFIDFLLCLVMFLLVTAVWSHMARLQADAQVPGKDSTDPPSQLPKELHVDMTSEKLFNLSWLQGTTVVESIDVARKAVEADGSLTYPELSSAVEKAWRASGSHTKSNDTKFDRAIIHSNNSDAFAEVSAVLDAISTPQRELRIGTATAQFPAFQIAYAVN